MLLYPLMSSWFSSYDLLTRMRCVALLSSPVSLLLCCGLNELYRYRTIAIAVCDPFCFFSLYAERDGVGTDTRTRRASKFSN